MITAKPHKGEGKHDGVGLLVGGRESKGKGDGVSRPGVPVFPSVAHDLAKTEERSERARDEGEEQKENLLKFNLRALDEFRYVISLVGKKL